jgi:deoxyribodipyrimidine photo-lyase
MHGYMRMYWAKQLLRWTHEPREAYDLAVHLNDKFRYEEVICYELC